jgi:hypothetical protein
MKALLTLLLAGSICLHADVRVTAKGEGFELLRNGQPYFVKGGGGDVKACAALAAAGGNSLRVWGADGLGEILDTAQKHGLTVCAGIWLGQVRQGFDWNNANSLARQREQVRATVQKFKDHPALLCWALGNEMEDPEGRNLAVWKGINDLAAMVKELDPAHPTMTVVAEIGGEKVKNLHQLCPQIDLVGINSYGGAASVAERYRKAGGTKPYLVTEYGPRGSWETKPNAHGTFDEPTSTEKAATYRAAYAGAIAKQPLCLGGYAFLWGQKQEVTATWFSMFLHDGTRLGAVDALQEIWTGSAPKNRCPEMPSLALAGVEKPVDPGTKLHASLKVSDPEGDALKVEWVLQRDPGKYGTGGDHEAAPPTFPDAISHGTAEGAEIQAPEGPGLYRLFALVRDGHGGGAVGNVVFRIGGAEKIAPAQKGTLPLTIYTEAEAATTYQPTGWMGDTKAIKLDPAHAQNPHTGKTCLHVEFAVDKGWGGIVWQHPAGDWGEKSGGFDLTGAKRVSFWARGEKGGEKVTFKYGLLGKDKPFADSSTGALEVTLTKEWTHYEISTAGKDLSRIKTAFCWTVAAQGAALGFCLDDVQWE